MDQERLIEFSESLVFAADKDALTAACREFANSLGYDYFIYGAFFPLTEEIVILNGFPESWRVHYDTAGYVYHDPTVKHCSVNTTPIEWSKIEFSKGKAGEQEKEVMTKGAEHGVGYGVSLPVHGPGGEWGMMSLAKAEPHDPEVLDKATRHSEFIAKSIHESLKRIVHGGTIEVLEELTARERECLQWTANGKTAWEIAQILDISENTVAFHLKNSISKMQVSNRAQAIAKAVAQSRITLF